MSDISDHLFDDDNWSQPAEPARKGPDFTFLLSPSAFIFHYLRARRYEFLVLAALVTMASFSAVGIQYQFKLMIDAMAQGPGGAVWTYLFALIALFVTESVLWRLSGWLGCRFTLGAGLDMRLDLFDRLAEQQMKYFSDNLTGSLGQRVTATAGNFGAISNTLVWRIVPPCVDFIGAAIVFSTIDPAMTLVSSTFVVGATAGLILLGQWGAPLHAAYARDSGEVAGELNDVISNMWSVKAFCAQRRERTRLLTHIQREARSQTKSWMYLERMRLLYDAMLWILTGGMLSWALAAWSHGRISMGDVVVISTLTLRIMHGARDLALAFVDLAQNVGRIDDTLKVICKTPAFVDHPDRRTLHCDKGQIEFRGIRFAFRAHGRPVLDDFDLVIPSGQKVGVVGPSGAGKSTLLNLLQHLHEPDAGQIFLDGQPLANFTQDSLREVLGVVPQDISLFHRSVFENIRVGRPDARDDEVFAAARAAQCEDFINRLPEGYNTIVGERGARLSGGQRQRVAIARVILKNAPVTLLDEATSALDTESEQNIQRALLAHARDRTIIAVAHRLSTVSAFDRILVICDGRIVEDGSPDELRLRGVHFKRIWAMQAQSSVQSVA